MGKKGKEKKRKEAETANYRNSCREETLALSVKVRILNNALEAHFKDHGPHLIPDWAAKLRTDLAAHTRQVTSLKIQLHSLRREYEDFSTRKHPGEETC